MIDTTPKTAGTKFMNSFPAIVFFITLAMTALVFLKFI
jgi:hypothetical protein